MDELQRLERRYRQTIGMVDEVLAKTRLLVSQIHNELTLEELNEMRQRVRNFNKDLNKYERVLGEIKKSVKGLTDGIT